MDTCLGYPHRGCFECGLLATWFLVLLVLFPFVPVLTKSSSVVGLASLLTWFVPFSVIFCFLF